ncbi:serine/threonine-protein kinase [Nonomuraea sp. NPDC046802]|uniref:serine/threonine-protein kinase n=1 Tax=Nonomuraea sp. NPDC046802 TaxID=3154919 RepID=UPI0033CDE724
MVADRYRLDERIGAGPMGEVWRGYDTRADWVVAVKVLGARVAGAATREVLRQHAQAVARVIHPNVAMVLDVGEQDGSPFLVMEHLTGLSLGEERAAAQGPMNVVEICDLVGQAAAGLDAAHRAGIVHGRVDPDSFRRAGSGVLKVVGFGMDERSAPSGEGRYAAPERAAGGAAEASGDLYSLGCVCYELLTGRLPFDGEQGSAPAPPSAFRPDVSPELDRLVLAMISEAPAKRPAGGEAIRRSLAAIARPRANPAAMPVTGVSLRDGGLSTAPTGPSQAPARARPSQAGHFPAGPGGGRGATEVLPLGGPGGGARAGDTAIYQAGDVEPAASSNRKLFLQLGAAVAVIAAVTVGMVLMAGAGDERVAAPTPTPLATTFTAVSPSPPSLIETSPEIVATTGPDPTSLRETAAPKGTLLGEAVPTGGWGRWLEQFDAALTYQQTMGQINPSVADKARDKIRKAGRKFQEGEIDSTIKEISGVYRDLRKAQEKGDMGSTGPLAEMMGDWRLPSGRQAGPGWGDDD